MGRRQLRLDRRPLDQDEAEQGLGPGHLGAGGQPLGLETRQVDEDRDRRAEGRQEEKEIGPAVLPSVLDIRATPALYSLRSGLALRKRCPRHPGPKPSPFSGIGSPMRSAALSGSPPPARRAVCWARCSGIPPDASPVSSLMPTGTPGLRD